MGGIEGWAKRTLRLAGQQEGWAVGDRALVEWCGVWHHVEIEDFFWGARGLACWVRDLDVPATVPGAAFERDVTELVRLPQTWARTDVEAWLEA